MDTAPPRPSDDEVERLLLCVAVEEARRDKRPGISNEVVMAELVKQIAQLDMQIVADVGSLDPEKAELFYKMKAVNEARENPGPYLSNEAVCAEMLAEIEEIDQEIAALIGK